MLYGQVDASYLSPHVHMSDTLEALTKIYGTPILMSGQFFKILSKCVCSPPRARPLGT